MTNSISNSISNLNSYSSSTNTVSGASSGSASSTLGTLSSSGIGSGINVSQLVSQLMTVAQAPINQLNSKNSSLNNQISAYGQLSGAISSFQVSLGSLMDPTAYDSVTAVASNPAVISASAGSSASQGTYNIVVNRLASAQTLVAAGQTSSTSAMGSGIPTTLSFQFGSTSGSGSNAAFTQDASFGGGSVVIDSSNNSLSGMASAINAAGVGVRATVVNDGSGTPWRLSLTSTKTGAHSTMKITVSGDSAIQSMLSEDPAGTSNLTETQTASDASVSVDGLQITSSTNTLNNAIQGVNLNLGGTGSSLLTLSPSTSNIASNVRAFVTAYNTLDSGINQLTADASASAGTSAGPLAGQFTALQVQAQLRRMLGTTMVDPAGKPISLTDLGITFQKDGTLALNSATLNSLIQSNPAKVGAVFARNTVASDKTVSVASTGPATQAGSYAVTVSHLATQGDLKGTGVMPNSITITSGQNDSVSVSIDGVMASIKLAAGTYSQSDFATALQAAINGNSTLAAAQKSVAISVNNNTMDVVSQTFGSGSFVSLYGAAIDTAFGGSQQSTFTSGTDIVGSIDGLPALGNGQTLVAQSGQASGLSLLISSGSTGPRGSVSVSSGLANSLNTLANSFSSSTGMMSQAMNALQATIKENNSAIARLNAQLAIQQAALQTEFSSLDTTISQLNNMQSYLTSQFNSMAATQGYIYGSGSSRSG